MGGESARPGGLGREQKLALIAIAALLALGGIGALVLSAGSSDPSTPVAESAYPNVDPSNSRHSGGSITADTVSKLEVAWSQPIKGQGRYGAEWSTPVIANGVAYVQDMDSNVQAIELSSGKVLWERQYNSPVEGPNGVVAIGNRVFGATAEDAFALNRSSGEELWSVTLPRNSGEAIDMAPGYRDGLVYISTIPSALRGGEVGVLWALNAKTGRKVWRFATVPKNLWGHPRLNFGGGLWQAPAFDSEGSMYVGIANPGPAPGPVRYLWGTSRPGPNLYTNSVVKLNAKTGKLDWYYQLTPHALCDWDLQGPPMLIDAGNRNLVVIAGKSGIVIAVDRDSGKLVWKRSVGIHNGHDRDGPRAMKGNYSNLRLPLTVYPGSLGGVMGQLSTDGSHIFAPVTNHATTLTRRLTPNEAAPKTGELIAIDAASGSISWKHKFSSAAVGATNVVNDLVFATTLDGTVYAFEDESGKLAWQSSLPAGISAGLGFSESMLLAPAGVASKPNQSAELVAYRLGV